MRALLVTLALTAALATSLVPAAAWACGGFFCANGPGNTPPVVQTGEKILFAFEDGRVTAHVQILYQGEPRDFAWVVPTPSQPTLKVGSDQVFSLIDAATQPSFTVNWTEFCSQPMSFGCASSPTAFEEAPNAAEPSPGVTVVSQGPVGPFDTAVLSATEPDALKQWLDANGYDLAPQAEPLIASYVEKGDYFVALKLQSDRGVGDLQPIVLEYIAPEGPCVPIRLTAVAAQPNLGVAVFLLGDARAVPENYLHVEINEAKLDWMTSGTNYPQVVAQAVDEAGGQGFVTDYSGPVSVVQPQIAQAHSNYLRSATETTDPVSFVEVINGTGLLGSSQNVLGLLQRCVPQPESVNLMPADFYANIRQFEEALADVTVEQPACADDFEALVIEPLREVDALMQKHPVLTRLYTTLDPEEMTLDPIFTFNKELPEVSLARTVSGRQLCDGSTPTHAEFTTQDGQTFVVPWGQTLEEGPSLKLATETSAEGQPIPVIDNREEVAATWGEGGCSCALAAGPSFIGLGLLAMGLGSRKRRSARAQR